MNLHFYKYQGTGNDFIVLDNREGHFSLDERIIAQLCDRRFGVGGDGLMLLENAPNYDFRMVYYNADGNESSMCGNGGRCLVAFAKKLGIFTQKTRFLAVDGAHEAVFLADNRVSLKMQDVQDVAMDGMDFVLNTGSPHFVRMVYDAKTVQVVQEGRKVRNSDRYKAEGINVNFVSRKGNGIVVTTYERGVEDETLSCGTGVTAAAIAAFLYQKMAAKKVHEYGNMTDEQQVEIETKGGALAVSFQLEPTGSLTNVWLTGAAELVFEGFLDWKR